MKRVRLFITTVLAGVFFFSMASAPSAGAIDVFSGACGGAGNNAVCSARKDDFTTLMGNIVSTLFLVIGMIAVIMIIIGGFKYITSGGDSGNVTGAKNTILYAIVGLVIVALAQFVVKFVLAKATGATG